MNFYCYTCIEQIIAYIRTSCLSANTTMCSRMYIIDDIFVGNFPTKETFFCASNIFLFLRKMSYFLTTIRNNDVWKIASFLGCKKNPVTCSFRVKMTATKDEYYLRNKDSFLWKTRITFVRWIDRSIEKRKLCVFIDVFEGRGAKVGKQKPR